MQEIRSPRQAGEKIRKGGGRQSYFYTISFCNDDTVVLESREYITVHGRGRTCNGRASVQAGCRVKSVAHT